MELQSEITCGSVGQRLGEMILDYNYWKEFCKRTGVPLDQIDTQDPFNNRASFTYAYSIWPRRCYNTQRWIWGIGMRGRTMWAGPGEPVVEDRWYHKHEAVIMMLKKVSE